jgi:superfamily I DNA/RNA helicase|tara:strand:- start:7423 stop:8886 length:1464 start_codon:yes stop_codon:yes gene_type:complete
MSSNWNIIFGPPGTGKTTYGIKFIETLLSKGTDPGSIGFITFTRKASIEARTRAQEKFSLTDDDLNNFRTIHSLCFRQLGIRPAALMQKQHWIELGEILGIEVTGMGSMNDEAYATSMPMGDRLFFLDNLARITRRTLREVFEQTVDDDLSYDQLIIASKSLLEYKQKHELLDFTDILDKWIKIGTVPKLEALFVDEAQDLSKMQWEVVHKLSKDIPLKYAAGDDDQAIYRWAGAAVEEFINLTGTKKVLSHSYRLPKAVHSIATDILHNIGYRQEKEFTHNGTEGYVEYHYSVDDLDLSEGTWLLLARNTYLLRDYERVCELNGYPYESPQRKPLESAALRAIKDWVKLCNGETCYGKQIKNVRRFHGFSFKVDDERIYTLSDLPVPEGPWFEVFTKISPNLREYFLAARRQGESLNTPRININTIHGVKGGEADHVAIITDMASRSYRYMEMFPDDEHRVFYVAATRAKSGLNIIQPQSRLFYEI